MFQVGFVFSKDSWPKWGYTDIWAPEIHRINGTFYVYFSVRKRSGKTTHKSKRESNGHTFKLKKLKKWASFHGETQNAFQ